MWIGPVCLAAERCCGESGAGAGGADRPIRRDTTSASAPKDTTARGRSTRHTTPSPRMLWEAEVLGVVIKTGCRRCNKSRDGRVWKASATCGPRDWEHCLGHLVWMTIQGKPSPRKENQRRELVARHPERPQDHLPAHCESLATHAVSLPAVGEF